MSLNIHDFDAVWAIRKITRKKVDAEEMHLLSSGLTVLIGLLLIAFMVGCVLYKLAPFTECHLQVSP